MSKQPKEPRVKKKAGPIRKIFNVLGILVLVFIVLIGILAAVYFTSGIDGVLKIPGLAAVLGLDKPKDLGAGAVTVADQASLVQKFDGVDPASWSDVPSGGVTKKIEVVLTTKETSALLMDGGGSRILKDVQLAPSGEEGGVAAAGLAQIDGLLESSGMTRADLEAKIGALPDTVPFYVELTAVPTEDGSLGITLTEIKIGAIEIPVSMLGLTSEELDPYVRDFFLNTYGIGLDSFSSGADGLELNLEVPEAG
jgi:hypothetical protein